MCCFLPLLPSTHQNQEEVNLNVLRHVCCHVIYDLYSSVRSTNILTCVLCIEGSAAVLTGGHPGRGVVSEEEQ